jgi:hypothetical protein
MRRFAAVVVAVVAVTCAERWGGAAGKATLAIGMPTDVPIFDTHKTTGLHNGGILALKG